MSNWLFWDWFTMGGAIVFFVKTINLLKKEFLNIQIMNEKLFEQKILQKAENLHVKKKEDLSIKLKNLRICNYTPA